jgi:hypothetical protein
MANIRTLQKEQAELIENIGYGIQQFFATVVVFGMIIVMLVLTLSF